MKKIKWKVLITTSVLCLLPIILGVAFWNKLPEQMAIHFDINNNPDNYASKAFTVFGLPLLMMLLQIFCCIINDIKGAINGTNKKFEAVIKSIIPVITFIIYTVTIVYALGVSADIRRIAMFIAGSVFIAVGNYIPKLGYLNTNLNRKITGERAKKINRIIGYESVIMGVVFIITVFLPPVFSLAALFLIIPYAVGTITAAVKIK